MICPLAEVMLNPVGVTTTLSYDLSVPNEVDKLIPDGVASELATTLVVPTDVFIRVSLQTIVVISQSDITE